MSNNDEWWLGIAERRVAWVSIATKVFIALVDVVTTEVLVALVDVVTAKVLVTLVVFSSANGIVTASVRRWRRGRRAQTLNSAAAGLNAAPGGSAVGF